MAVAASGPRFENPEQLGAWLRTREHDVSVALAVRASLRVLPLIFEDAGFLQGEALSVKTALQIIRVNFVNWAAALDPAHASKLRPADSGVSAFKFIAELVGGTTRWAGEAAVLAANAANAASYVPNAERAIAAAVEAAHRAYPSGGLDVWDSIGEDANRFHEMKPSELLHQRLWLGHVASASHSLGWASAQLDRFYYQERVEGGLWGVWLEWYRELMGLGTDRHFDDDRALKIASMDESFWLDDPHRINASVAAMVGWKGNESQRPSPAEAETKGPVDSSKSRGPAKKQLQQGPATRKARVESVQREASPPPPPPSEAVRIHSDEPTEIDLLNRETFGRALVEHMDEVYNQRAPDGFAVHIHAPWGAGKTSVIKMMRKMLERTGRRSKGGRPAPQWVVVEFNAWKNERRNPPWWPLVQEARRACMAATDGFDAIRLRHYWFWWAVRANWLPYVVAALVVAISAIVLWYTWNSTGAQALVETTLKLVTAAAAICVSFIGASRIAAFGSSSNAKFYEDLSQDPLERILRLFVKAVESTGKPVCIIVDDLDRCRPEYVVSLLQGIQTAFRHPSVAWIVAADRHWIRTSFENQYGSMAAGVANPGQPLGYLFLEKVFQISTPLPGISPVTRARFWEQLLKKADDRAGNAGPLSIPVLSERSVEDKRAALRSEEPNLTRARADELLKSSASPEDRAAIVLELSASPAAEAETTHLLSRFKDVVSDIPRMMKRTVNAFAVRQAIGALEDNAVAPMILARWTILEQRFPALADLLAEHPDWISQLRSKKKTAMPAEVRAALTPFLDSAEIAGILGGDTDTPLTADAVRTITRGAAGQGAAA